MYNSHRQRIYEFHWHYSICNECCRLTSSNNHDSLALPNCCFHCRERELNNTMLTAMLCGVAFKIHWLCTNRVGVSRRRSKFCTPNFTLENNNFDANHLCARKNSEIQWAIIAHGVLCLFTLALHLGTTLSEKLHSGIALRMNALFFIVIKTDHWFDEIIFSPTEILNLRRIEYR